MARRKIDFKYQECDIPRTEEIERYMKMSDEELEALIENITQEARRKRKQEDREREKGK